jgi:hypothetical protein
MTTPITQPVAFSTMSEALGALGDIVHDTTNTRTRDAQLDTWLDRFAITMEQQADNAPRPNAQQAQAIYTYLRTERPLSQELAARLKTTTKWANTVYNIANGDSRIPYYSLQTALNELKEPELNGLMVAGSVSVETSVPPQNLQKGHGK